MERRLWIALYRGNVVDPVTKMPDLNRVSNVILFKDLPDFKEVRRLSRLIFGYSDVISHTWGEMPSLLFRNEEGEISGLTAYNAWKAIAEVVYQLNPKND